MITRLVHVGNAVVDVVLRVPSLPARGGDVLAENVTTTTGGAFNVMAAAARLGLPVTYGGLHGTGRYGELVRADLAREGIAVVQPESPDGDTGFVVTHVEPDGERTFVTSPGVEATLDLDALDRLDVTATDAVSVSGYSLAFDSNRAALEDWLPNLPGGCTVVFDPGSLVPTLPSAAVTAVLERAGWITCNAAEARALTGRDDPREAAAALRRRNAIVRLGARGCLVARDGDVQLVPSVPVQAVDSTGAGDTHTGAFVASLADGLDPVAAAARANAAAAYAVTRRGPATGPTSAQLSAFLADQH